MYNSSTNTISGSCYANCSRRSSCTSITDNGSVVVMEATEVIVVAIIVVAVA